MTDEHEHTYCDINSNSYSHEPCATDMNSNSHSHESCVTNIPQAFLDVMNFPTSQHTIETTNVETTNVETTNVETTNVDTYKDDMEKYTKIDNLDEDPVVESGRFFLVSFISPEGVMNCTTRGLKIRTFKNKVCFETLEEAKHAADEINKRDKYFNVFVGETGKWMGWDPAPDDRTKVEDEVWADADQNKLMQKMREKEEKQKTQLDELNALVGKKKDIIKNEKKAHKNRVKTAIKDSANNAVDTEVVTEEQMEQEQEEQKSLVKPALRNPRLIREKLRKKLEEKKLNNPKFEKPVTTEDVLREKNNSNSNEEKINSNIEKLMKLRNKSK
jgi:hypothetical protein